MNFFFGSAESVLLYQIFWMIAVVFIIISENHTCPFLFGVFLCHSVNDWHYDDDETAYNSSDDGDLKSTTFCFLLFRCV